MNRGRHKKNKKKTISIVKILFYLVSGYKETKFKYKHE